MPPDTYVPATDAAMTRRRAVLFDRLLALFLAEGFLQFTVEDLSTRLRCSKTTLYALAPSKEQLARAAIIHFFRGVADGVEGKVAEVADPQLRVVRYLTAVSEELAPASTAFYRDLELFEPGRVIYEQNTELAAGRVRQLIAAGVESGAFRNVHAAFVSDTIASCITRIGRGHVTMATGLDAAQAYRELADLVLHGISA
jgi:AcrR family transcriptional regulator